MSALVVWLLFLPIVLGLFLVALLFLIDLFLPWYRSWRCLGRVRRAISGGRRTRLGRGG